MGEADDQAPDAKTYPLADKDAALGASSSNASAAPVPTVPVVPYAGRYVAAEDGVGRLVGRGDRAELAVAVIVLAVGVRLLGGIISVVLPALGGHPVDGAWVLFLANSLVQLVVNTVLVVWVLLVLNRLVDLDLGMAGGTALKVVALATGPAAVGGLLMTFSCGCAVAPLATFITAAALVGVFFGAGLGETVICSALISLTVLGAGLTFDQWLTRVFGL